MLTKILIEGQISGNFTLARSLSSFSTITEKTSFNGFRIVFKTKKEARKALWEAFKYLRNNEPEFKRGISYSKYGLLRYDASSAKILNNN